MNLLLVRIAAPEIRVHESEELVGCRSSEYSPQIRVCRNENSRRFCRVYDYNVLLIIAPHSGSRCSFSTIINALCSRCVSAVCRYQHGVNNASNAFSELECNGTYMYVVRTSRVLFTRRVRLWFIRKVLTKIAKAGTN